MSWNGNAIDSKVSSAQVIYSIWYNISTSLNLHQHCLSFVIIKEGTKFLCGKVLPSIDASNLVNLHRTESTFCVSRGQKYLSLCWFKNLTRGCNIEEEKSSLSSVPLNRVMCVVYVSKPAC